MGCCGGKRQQLADREMGVRQEEPPPAPVAVRTVTFEYTGRTGVTVLGPLTQTRYRFGGPGATVAADSRDAPFLHGVPNLRVKR